MSQSSEMNETTPLLRNKESVDDKTEATKPKNYTSEPACKQNPAAVAVGERDEAGPSASEEAEASKKRRETDEEEMADAINSYEGIADIVTPRFGCGLVYGIWLLTCHCLSSFIIQFPLHVLLLCLPISVGFMGAKYMHQCPMSANLPYAMMALGVVGTLVLLVRLTLLLHTKYSTEELLKKWLKNGTKILECIFIISFIFELYFSYEKTPSHAPLSAHYCNETFYNFVCSMNNALIALVIVWIFLYFITGPRCMRRAVPP